MVLNAQALKSSKEELVQRVEGLKKARFCPASPHKCMACLESEHAGALSKARCLCLQDLADWRVRLNSQVEQYQTEMGGLRTQLMTEMEALRSEFLDMRVSLQKQMDATWTAVDSADQAAQPQQEQQQHTKPVEA